MNQRAATDKNIETSAKYKCNTDLQNIHNQSTNIVKSETKNPKISKQIQNNTIIT